MKVLHTSDWHLGQKLLQLDRQEEFALALDWLLEVIIAEQIDVLLVSGDIFDIGNPPNQSRELYYNFLRRLLNSECRHVVITGGNHDSPAMLNAPRELLAAFNIHIVG
ncbi:MAG: exonuclease subunit SbcD, partial [Bacteroidota bacterium]